MEEKKEAESLNKSNADLRSVVVGVNSGIIGLHLRGEAGLIWLENHPDLFDTLSIDATSGNRYICVAGKGLGRTINARLKIALGVDVMADGEEIAIPLEPDSNGEFCCFDDMDASLATCPAWLLVVIDGSTGEIGEAA
jgi:hypothetical protein